MRAHQYISPWSSQENRTLDNLIFYLLNLASVLGRLHFRSRNHCMYLLLLLRAVCGNVPHLVAHKTSSFAHVLHPIDLHWLSWSSISRCRPVPGPWFMAWHMGGRFGCRGTCRATYYLVVVGGGIRLLAPSGLLLAALFIPMHLVVDEHLSLLIHDEDSLLPFQIVARNSEANVGDDGGISRGYPSSDGMY